MPRNTRSTPRTGRAVFSPLFIVAAVILAAAALGLRPAIDELTDHYSKEPIALRKQVQDMNVNRIPSWRIARQPVLHMGAGDVETEDVAVLVLEPDVKGYTPSPFDQAMLFVTYYSDPRDSIPHTPEVCYRQGGAVIDDMRTIPVDTPGLGPDTPQVQGRLLDIDTFGHRNILVYVFVCNGKYYFDREAVRFAIGWPGDKFTYFSKVEVVTKCPTDGDYEDAIERCKSLLGEALAVLVQDHFPTRQQVQR